MENMRFIYILSYVSIVFAFPIDECNKANILGRTCYSIHTQSGKLSYKESKNVCLKNKGNLARISDQKTFDFLSEILSAPSYNHSSDPLWIEFITQRLDGSWTSAKSRANRYHYSRVSCTRLDVKSLKAAQTSCGHLYYPLCQYETSNCSLSTIAIPFTNLASCTSNSTTPFNTTLTVHCTNGYILQGPQTLTCQPNGSWTTLPKCIAKCLPPLVTNTVQIHNFKPEYNIGDKVLLVCLNGYFPGGKYLKSHRITTCKPDGQWEDISTLCIPEEQLNCPAEVCQNIQRHLEIDENVSLNCTGSEQYGVDLWPHFHWLKDHEKVHENSRLKLHQDGGLELNKFQPSDRGIYTCVRGMNENNVEKVVVYDIRLKYKCEIDPRGNLPSIIVQEETSVYLKSKGEGVNVAWFKDGRRVWGDKRRIVLPSGDLLIRRAAHRDAGYFTFEIESETYTDVCIDRTVKLSVIPRASSICGLAEPLHPHPWLTSLWWNQETLPFCYGALVSESWVLTSGFCLSRFHRLKEHLVSVGFGFGGNLRKIKVDNITLHPFYSKRLNVNDLGLVKLTAPAVFGDSIRPICIPEEDFAQIGRPCVAEGKIVGNVSGFGSLEAVNKGGMIRAEAMVSVDTKACEKHVVFQFPDTMYCAEVGDKENEVFAGDVGAPFETSRDGRTYVYGVYSWGQRLAQVGYFDYFTKIAPYYRWIKDQLV